MKCSHANSPVFSTNSLTQNIVFSVSTRPTKPAAQNSKTNYYNSL